MQEWINQRMQRSGDASFRMPRSVRLGTTVLVCGALCVLLVLPSLAQEAGLRGTVEAELAKDASPLARKTLKRKKNSQASTPMPEYRPVSGNGLPDDVLLNPADGLSSEEDTTTSAAASANDDPLIPDPPTAQADPQKAQSSDSLASDSDVPTPDGRPQRLGDEDPDTTAGIAGNEFARAERAGRENQREPSIEGSAAKAVQDPFTAPGIAVGSFTLRPTLDTGLRWTSNSDSSAGGKPAYLSETTLRLRADSNWSRHRLALEAFGSWQKSVSGEETDDPESGLAAEFQVDVSAQTALTGALSWNYSKEAASAPAAVVGALTQPDLNKLAGSLGLSHQYGPIGLRLNTNLERSSYGDATDSLGVLVSQEDRNNTFAGVTLRAGYDISPAITPFVEAELGRRIFDNESDSFGLARAATRYAGRAGMEMDLGEKLRGNIAAGYLLEDIDDNALEDVAGLSLAGNLTWSPIRGTNVNLNATTTVEGSSSATSSGSLLHALSVAVNHKARDNFDLNANLGASLRDYVSASPNEITLSAGAGFIYWFNRYAGLNGRVAHETVLSSDATRESQTNSVYLGVTLRR